MIFLIKIFHRYKQAMTKYFSSIINIGIENNPNIYYRNKNRCIITIFLMIHLFFLSLFSMMKRKNYRINYIVHSIIFGTLLMALDDSNKILAQLDNLLSSRNQYTPYLLLPLPLLLHVMILQVESHSL